MADEVKSIVDNDELVPEKSGDSSLSKDTEKEKRTNKVVSDKKKDVVRLSPGNRVKIKKGSRWVSGDPVQEWVLQKTLYVRSIPKDNKCLVSISQQELSTGSGEIFIKDLIKL